MSRPEESAMALDKNTELSASNEKILIELMPHIKVNATNKFEVHRFIGQQYEEIHCVTAAIRT